MLQERNQRLCKKETKPHVAFAGICEKVLQDLDGTLSLIRIIDTVFVRVQLGTLAGVVPAFAYVAVVSLQFADSAAAFDRLKIVMRTPIGKVTNILDNGLDTVMIGTHQGITIQINLTGVVDQYGVFWFDVLWDDDVLTSFSLHVQLGK